MSDNSTRFENLINKAKKFKLSSLKYKAAEDISEALIVINEEDKIFIYSKLTDQVRIDWAATSKDSFFTGLKESITIISDNLSRQNIVIEFIPPDFVADLENYGFKVRAEWMDFWNDKLQLLEIEKPDLLSIRKIKEKEYQFAVEISRSCHGYSRGFIGESIEWFREWNEDDNSTIFIASRGNKLLAFCCVKLYGFDSEEGIVLWIREIAVNPAYHSRKIGLNLLVTALNWGKSKGAVRSFLACDRENNAAISLYEGLGYQRKTSCVQIDMEMESFR